MRDSNEVDYNNVGSDDESGSVTDEEELRGMFAQRTSTCHDSDDDDEDENIGPAVSFRCAFQRPDTPCIEVSLSSFASAFRENTSVFTANKESAVQICKEVGVDVDLNELPDEMCLEELFGFVRSRHDVRVTFDFVPVLRVTDPGEVFHPKQFLHRSRGHSNLNHVFRPALSNLKRGKQSEDELAELITLEKSLEDALKQGWADDSDQIPIPQVFVRCDETWEDACSEWSAITTKATELTTRISKQDLAQSQLPREVSTIADLLKHEMDVLVAQRVVLEEQCQMLTAARAGQGDTLAAPRAELANPARPGQDTMKPIAAAGREVQDRLHHVVECMRHLVSRLATVRTATQGLAIAQESFMCLDENTDPGNKQAHGVVHQLVDQLRQVVDARELRLMAWKEERCSLLHALFLVQSSLGVVAKQSRANQDGKDSKRRDSLVQEMVPVEVARALEIQLAETAARLNQHNNVLAELSQSHSELSGQLQERVDHVWS